MRRQHELLRLRCDKGLAPLLRKREAHQRLVARKREVDDAADPELHPAAHAGLGRARQLDRDRTHLLDCHHGPGALYVVMRVATLYFVTDVRRPGVSPAGIAFSISSPRA
jgi:hypothetical protein